MTLGKKEEKKKTRKNALGTDAIEHQTAMSFLPLQKEIHISMYFLVVLCVCRCRYMFVVIPVKAR